VKQRSGKSVLPENIIIKEYSRAGKGDKIKEREGSVSHKEKPFKKTIQPVLYRGVKRGGQG